MKSSDPALQYPPQNGPYRTIIKGKNLWRGHKTARFQLSMGNPKQDGDKFAALSEWAALRFDRVILIVSDSLQRHNIAADIGVSHDKAHLIALHAGQEWLSRNMRSIQSLPAFELTFWDDWLLHPRYPEARAAIDGLYAVHGEFRSAVERKVDVFCVRHGHGDKMKAASREYLLEELAAFSIMFRDTPAADFYAGTALNDLFAIIADVSGNSLLSGFKAAYVSEVDFVRNSQFYARNNRAA